MALLCALERILETQTEERELLEERAWKLWCLLPLMLLRRTQGSNKEGRKELQQRFQKFWRGEWLELIAAGQGRARTAAAEDTKEKRARTACHKVRLGEASRAAQTLTAGKLAPGTDATLEELTDPNRRPRDQLERLPDEVANFRADTPLELDTKLSLSVLRAAPRGPSAALTGWRYEHLKVALDNERTAQALAEVATLYAQAKLPGSVAKVLSTGTLTALLKDNGRVRGIVAGDSLRRLVARTLAKQFGPEMEAACAPYQYALSTRAGTECVAHVLRAALEEDSLNTILSVDGIGAYDLVRRRAMLQKLRTLPKAKAMLPFVLLSYGQPSEYLWVNDEGEVKTVKQGEGGEQGDPLMPALFSLGQHAALEAIANELLPTEKLMAFLDDVYLLCKPERVKHLYERVAYHLEAHTGIRLNMGKTKVYNRGGAKPPGVDALQSTEPNADRVWVGDRALPAHKQGVVVLGSPVGTLEFAEAHGRKKLEEEVRLLDLLSELPDLQCAWTLLLQCAAPRANYHLRCQPPKQVELYATAHDVAVWHTLCSLIGRDDLAGELESRAARVSQLPLRLGGCGLRSALRTAPAAYWASWADALPMIRTRNPGLANGMLAQLEGAAEATPCVKAALEAKRLVEAAGYRQCPDWRAVWNGKRPEQTTEAEPGEWKHGWQYFAATHFEKQFRDGAVMTRRASSSNALLRSQSGRGSGAHLTTLPVDEARTLKPHHLRLILLRRLRLQLPLDVRRCKCGGLLDTLGDHRAACSTVGKLAQRAKPLEKAWARVCREAGARVLENQLVRDFNLEEDVADTDGRRLEVLADNLPLWSGVQLAVDATLVSPVKRDGVPQPKAAVEDGCAWQPQGGAKRRSTLNCFATEDAA